MSGKHPVAQEANTSDKIRSRGGELSGGNREKHRSVSCDFTRMIAHLGTPLQNRIMPDTL